MIIAPFLVLIHILSAFLALALGVAISFFVAGLIAKRRQARWLEKAVAEVELESKPSWVRRREMRRIK